MLLYAIKRKDPEFSEQVNQAKEVLADRFEEELLTVDKMPQVVARLARLKTLRPDYRDSFKVVVGSPKVEALVEELHRLGKQPKQITEGGEAVSLIEGEVSAK